MSEALSSRRPAVEKRRGIRAGAASRRWARARSEMTEQTVDVGVGVQGDQTDK